MQAYKDIAQAVNKTDFDGNEQGIETQGAKAIRIIVRAPAGQQFNAGFTVCLATRHHRLGVFAMHPGTIVSLTSTSEIQAHAGVLVVSDPLSKSAVLVGHVPVAPDFGDELLVFVVGADLGGDPADGTEAGKVFIHLERLER